MISSFPSSFLSVRALAVIAASWLLCTGTWAATWTVNDAGDAPLGGSVTCSTGEPCTLRAAIQRVNTGDGSGIDEIHFDIGSGGSVVMISPATVLPDIIRPVRILGYTQPGASPNSLEEGDNAVVLIRIDGVGKSFTGLTFSSDAQGSASLSELRGVAVTRFQMAGVALKTFYLHHVTIAGNLIGTDGVSALPNGTYGVVLINTGGINTVGGSSPADRNVIVSGNAAAVSVSSSHSTNIWKNHIGTDAAGTKRLGVGDGVVLYGSSEGRVLYNVIGSARTGVLIHGDSQLNRVRSNLIGVGSDGAAAIGGFQDGVLMEDDPLTLLAPQDNYIGGINGDSGGNVIANWSRNGVKIEHKVGGSAYARGNLIGPNSIYANGMLGIELVDTAANIGIGPNVGNPDVGVNDSLPFPMITSAQSNGVGTTVSYQFQGQSQLTLVVDAYANPSCHQSGYGEGKTYLGSFLGLQTDASGAYSAAGALLPPVPVGQFLTLTASDGSNNTSEFSKCFEVTAGLPPPPTPVDRISAVPVLGPTGLTLLASLLGALGSRQRRMGRNRGSALE